MIKPFLDDLEARINAQEEQDLYGRWKEFYGGKTNGDIFTAKRKNKYPARTVWPDIRINDAIRSNNYDKMIIRELKMASAALEKGAGNFLCIRSNYGTGILPSVFGADIFYLDDGADTLPTSKPVDGQDKIKAIIDHGIPRKTAGLMQKVFECAEYYLEAIKSYPKIRKHVHYYHADFQGPMDVVELLWGSALFLDICDSPGLVKQLLAVVTDSYIHFMKQWNKIMPPVEKEYSVHWDMLIKGQVALRNDSAMNFSPEMYNEFIRPYDQKIFDALGGGIIHFCGRGSHYIERMSRMNDLYAITLSQPGLNDMETIYANTIEKNIRLIGFDRDTAREAQERGRKFNGKIHCW